MSLISVKTKLAVASFVSAASYLSYQYYQKKNTQDVSKPITDDELKNAIIDAAKNYGKGDQKYKGIYLYSKSSNKLYLRSTDGNIYRAGNIDDCPSILDPNPNVTVYEIGNIYQTYACRNIPDEYKDQYKVQCATNPNGDVSVLMTSESDFEKKISEAAVGDIQPSQDICFNNSEGGDDDNGGLKPASTPEKFVESNYEKIGQLIGQLGLMVAAEKISMFFCISIFVLPGILKSSSWNKEKQTIMGGQMLYGWVINKLKEMTTEAIVETSSKEAVEEAEGSVFKVCQKIAAEIATKMELQVITKIFLKFADMINPLMTFISIAQILGMFIDVFDLCHLNNTNTSITQSILDNLGKGQNLMMNNLANYDIYGAPFDPSIWGYCDYDIDPTKCVNKFNNCKNQTFLKGQKWGDGKKISSQVGPREITKDDYCGDSTKEYQSHVNDYLKNLKVNSLGQCIHIPTNQEWAQILKYYIKDPNIDFSQLENVNASNYPTDLFPSSETAKMFDIFLVNQNTYVAQFIKDNFYYFLTLFIVILVIIFAI